MTKLTDTSTSLIAQALLAYHATHGGEPDTQLQEFLEGFLLDELTMWKHMRYEREKKLWCAANPRATHAEYHRAIAEIAARLDI